jgi:beta-N-acetylhexosaminidase
MTVRAFITSISGAALTRDELAFLREAAPWGLILFARNVESPTQGYFPRCGAPPGLL